MLRVIPTNIDSTFGWQPEEIPYREKTRSGKCPTNE